MYQYVIPGLVFRRARSGDRFIPLLCRLERRIDVDDHAAIVEQPVMNQLTDGEFRSPDFRYRCHMLINAIVLIDPSAEYRCNLPTAEAQS